MVDKKQVEYELVEKWLAAPIREAMIDYLKNGYPDAIYSIEDHYDNMCRSFHGRNKIDHYNSPFALLKVYHDENCDEHEVYFTFLRYNFRLCINEDYYIGHPDWWSIILDL